MSDRSDRISRLLSSHKSRVSYIRAKLAVLVPAQIRALRLHSTNPPMPRQSDLARESELHQSRISMFETPGAANMTLDTLSKIAAGLRCGLIVQFVPFSGMLRWENSFSPESNVTRIEQDHEFLNPAAIAQESAYSAAAAAVVRFSIKESENENRMIPPSHKFQGQPPSQQEAFYEAISGTAG